MIKPYHFYFLNILLSMLLNDLTLHQSKNKISSQKYLYMNMSTFSLILVANLLISSRLQRYDIFVTCLLFYFVFGFSNATNIQRIHQLFDSPFVVILGIYLFQILCYFSSLLIHLKVQIFMNFC